MEAYQIGPWCLSGSRALFGPDALLRPKHPPSTFVEWVPESSVLKDVSLVLKDYQVKSKK